MLPAVATAIIAGLGVAVAAYAVLRWITPTSKAEAAPIDITKVSLTVVAGVGGVVALVIAYRRQRDQEQSRFVERFGAAAAQLGATDVAVRIAGVYAMAGVADESDGLRRQQCIDVLCGYLRLPYSPELGANNQSKLVIKKHRATADGTRADDQEHHLEYRHNDREVRATIVRVIADHLRLDAEYSWSASDFDFRTAYLEDVNFYAGRFLGAARFEGATFSGTAWFGGATFSDTARFEDATFTGIAGFVGATFSRRASFEGVTFSDTALFEGVTFSDTALFEGVTFSEIAGFRGATFSGIARFEAATFTGPAEFEAATFSDTALFEGAIFFGPAEFVGATFTGIARFKAATFFSDAGFVGVTFSGPAKFVGVTFSRRAGFMGATFSETALFEGVTFTGPAEFEHSTFSGPAEFGDVTFSDTARFNNVDFGTAAVSFVGPRQWGPPPPVFDWNRDISRKPANVEPQNWPPAAVSGS
ncbi:pentapeptide repeat-containing protein [Nocardia wallacei]|uniref:pentapeptide repeat-containing protein n=1 Tax=Nocardia wallacei TaxID=480035 RepID=UPI0024575664|nr:pentapeptide repeat-containing protein [Nocardia wallacei]